MSLVSTSQNCWVALMSRQSTWDRLTYSLQPYSHLSVSTELCRTNVPMHNELRTRQRNEKWKWWRNRFNSWLSKPSQWLTSPFFPPFFLIFSPSPVCWSWVLIIVIIQCFFSSQKKVDPFVSTVHLPHPFRTEMNKVLVFTEVKTSSPPVSLNLHFIASWLPAVD